MTTEALADLRRQEGHWRSFRAHDLDCYIVRRMSDGKLEAFVAVPDWHPLYKKNPSPARYKAGLAVGGTKLRELTKPGTWFIGFVAGFLTMNYCEYECSILALTIARMA
jgi:hypothetical protein